MNKHYLLDTVWACGWIEVKNDVVVNGAPIFKKFIGMSIDKLKAIYKVQLLA